MLAWVNEYEDARPYFLNSLYPNPATNDKIKWNAYVNATLAFLDKNMEKLKKCKEILETPPPVEGIYRGLPFAKSFIIYFNKTYKEAFSAAFN